jgi:prepilin-type N-terminal cleavage/methylation domain-containing protein
MTRTRRGFSLIELLVVIGILLVLLGLATWGISSAQRSGRTQATHIALSNLKGMLTELDVSGGGGKQPATLYASGGPPLVSYSAPTPLDVWNDGQVETDTNPDPLINSAEPLLLPTQSLDESNPDRLNCGQIYNTQLVMAIVSAVPSSRAMIAQLPPDVTVVVPAPGQTAPILLDGWQNPIIFVPSSGLDRVVAYSATQAYPLGVYVLDGSNVFRSLGEVDAGTPTTDTDSWQPTSAPPILQSSDRRPFFASAGPDGSFAASDDNVYSFEN